MSPEELKFFAEVEALLNPVPTLTIEYRLHYNELGEIVLCTMVEHPNTTDYIVVTKDEYENYFRYQIVDGKLKIIDHDAGYRVKLEKSDTGYCVVKNHAGLILEPGETYITTEYYAHRNN
jgi:hypothetical protein